MAVTQLVTAEQFWDMPDIPGKQLELVRGEVVEMPTRGVIHNWIVGLLYRLLYAFATEHQLGLVFSDNTGYLLSRGPDTLRIPDASFITWEHVPDAGIPERAWEVSPDLAVEVVSPTDRPADVQNKVRDYLESGVRLVWVVWPKRQTVSAYAREATMRELGPNADLDGGDVLPGFRVRVGDLFEIPTKPE